MKTLVDCDWSKAAFTFNYAGARKMALDLKRQQSETSVDIKEDSKEEREIMELLGNVEKVKENFGGKQAFHEKIVIEKVSCVVNYDRNQY